MDPKLELLLAKSKTIESLRAEIQILRNLVKQKDKRIDQLTDMLNQIILTKNE
jgi:predicted RNase H-like nuclease (RuvC/YqgF family)